MYQSFYQLREAPFGEAPDPRFLFPSPTHREALAQLMYGVRERKGFITLTGEVGTGKTTLLRTLLEQVEPGTAIAFIPNSALPWDDLLEVMLREFGVAYPGGTRRVRLVRLRDLLLRRGQTGGNTVVIFDEAHHLDVPTLEAVRLLSNYETDTQKLLQIVLAGQPELIDKLRRPELRQLKQRIALHTGLQPLTPSETAEYVRNRLRAAGAASVELFTEPALQRIAAYSGGIPRVINVVCDHALVFGYAAQAPTIDVDLVDRVIAHLDDDMPRRRRFDVLRRLARGRAAAVAAAGLLLVIALTAVLASRPPAVSPPVAGLPPVAREPSVDAPSASAPSVLAQAPPAPAATPPPHVAAAPAPPSTSVAPEPPPVPSLPPPTVPAPVPAPSPPAATALAPPPPAGVAPAAPAAPAPPPLAVAPSTPVPRAAAPPPPAPPAVAPPLPAAPPAASVPLVPPAPDTPPRTAATPAPKPATPSPEPAASPAPEPSSGGPPERSPAPASPRRVNPSLAVRQAPAARPSTETVARAATSGPRPPIVVYRPATELAAVGRGDAKERVFSTFPTQWETRGDEIVKVEGVRTRTSGRSSQNTLLEVADVVLSASGGAPSRHWFLFEDGRLLAWGGADEWRAAAERHHLTLEYAPAPVRTSPRPGTDG
jgi:general secretion pathway protein A